MSGPPKLSPPRPLEPEDRAKGSAAAPLRAVLVSTYELGRQPFGLASPAAWLQAAGVDTSCVDLAVQTLPEQAIRGADLIAFYLPMHTATRLAGQVIPRVRALNPSAHLCVYGLYAAMNERYLRSLGVQSVLGGEFEEPLLSLAQQLQAAASPRTGRSELPLISLSRQRFKVPDRSGLPGLGSYACLQLPDGGHRIAGYTEATRGCKHVCRHCPVVPVYEGRFRVVQRDVVLADIDQQVEAGAQHITFGDPDFFNGPAHALAIVQELHERFPDLTYDVTIKVQHLVQQARHLQVLAETGCAFVTSAVEAFDERILELFDKRHSRQDFIGALQGLRAVGVPMNPTFVAFTPWTTLDIYVEFLVTIHQLGLVSNVAPIQYAIRLLIPQGSLLLELAETHQFLDGFDAQALCYRWRHPDPQVDQLQQAVLAVVEHSLPRRLPREEVFHEVCQLTAEAVPAEQRLRLLELKHGLPRVCIPYLTEPWYC